MKCSYTDIAIDCYTCFDPACSELAVRYFNDPSLPILPVLERNIHELLMIISITRVNVYCMYSIAILAY